MEGVWELRAIVAQAGPCGRIFERRGSAPGVGVGGAGAGEAKAAVELASKAAFGRMGHRLPWRAAMKAFSNMVEWAGDMLSPLLLDSTQAHARIRRNILPDGARSDAPSLARAIRKAAHFGGRFPRWREFEDAIALRVVPASFEESPREMAPAFAAAMDLLDDPKSVEHASHVLGGILAGARFHVLGVAGADRSAGAPYESAARAFASVAEALPGLGAAWERASLGSGMGDPRDAMALDQALGALASLFRWGREGRPGASAEPARVLIQALARAPGKFLAALLLRAGEKAGMGNSMVGACQAGREAREIGGSMPAARATRTVRKSL